LCETGNPEKEEASETAVRFCCDQYQKTGTLMKHRY